MPDPLQDLQGSVQFKIEVSLMSYPEPLQSVHAPGMFILPVPAHVEQSAEAGPPVMPA